MEGPIVVCELTGLPWKADTFRHKFREIAQAAGLPDNLQFRDLRATAVTELLDSDATETQAGTHVGLLTPAMVRRYGRRTAKQAEAAARKRVAIRIVEESESDSGEESEKSETD